MPKVDKKGKSKKARVKRAGVVSLPATGGTIVRTVVPRQRILRDGSNVVGCELISSLNVILADTVAANLPLIPAAANWLGGLARNYGRWKWNKLEYIYQPECGSNSSGGITIGVLYDTAESTPGSRTDLGMSGGAVTAPVWAGWEGCDLLSSDEPSSFGRRVPGAVKVFVDLKHNKGKFFPYRTLTNYQTDSVQDRNLFSPGFLIVRTSGGPATAIQAGNLWIKYDIDLVDPVNPASNT